MVQSSTGIHDQEVQMETTNHVSSASLDNTQERTVQQKPYWFQIEDPSWRNHLFDCGYVVIKGAVSPSDVATAKDLIWTDLEAATKKLDRNNPVTWNEKKWTLPVSGLMANLAQTAGPWHLRGLESVQEVFRNIWNTDDLITSMDAVILWRPNWGEGGWFYSPRTEGLHLDQNPFTKPQLDCVQGMIPLLPVTPEVGGLEVVPFSQRDENKKKFKADNPFMATRGDWCPLPHGSKHGNGAILLEAEPGDLILWDSRTIHGGRVGETGTLISEKGTQSAVNLARMSCTVAMTPREWATEEVLRTRKHGFKVGHSFNHCPHEAGTSSGTIYALRKKGYKKILLSDLTDSQKAVL